MMISGSSVTDWLTLLPAAADDTVYMQLCDIEAGSLVVHGRKITNGHEFIMLPVVDHSL